MHYTGMLCAATALTCVPAVADAQSTSLRPTENPATERHAEVDKDIVVTGTLIRGVAPVGSTVIAVDRKEIDASGLGSTADILKSIPQVTNIGPSSNSGGLVVQNSNLNNTRAEAINIRGIGPQATLPLLNGRRVPAGGPSAQLYDASSIPAIAIGRIDIVADGSSATYGSDAVAGVANFILRTDVEGVEVSGRYGFADDYNNRQLAIIVGHKWNHGGVMLAGQYDYNNELRQDKRPSYFNCNETTYGFANNCVQANGSPAAIGITAPGNLVFTTGATRVYGLPAGSGVGVTAAQLSTTPNSQATTANQPIIPPNSRYSTVFAGHIDVGNVTLWSEAYYTFRRTLIANGYLNFTSSVPNTNPNFVVVPGQSGATETVQYALVNEYGPVRRRVREEAWQAAVGFDYHFGSNFKLTAYYEHNNNREYNLAPGLNNSLLAAALACTGAVCFNPYGSGNSAGNAAAAGTFAGYQIQNAYYDSNLFNAKLDGKLFELPGGSVKIAVGGEYHWDKIFNYYFQNTTAASTTIDQLVVTTNTRYARKVSSVFGEVVVPIFGEQNAIPGLYKLTLNLAGRYDHYDDFGDTKNPKVGINWSPVKGVTLRGSYGTSFRAPTVCDINPLCTPSQLVSSTASTALYGQRTANSVTIVGGNSQLSPEIATTWSGGVDVRPSGVPGLSASINYFNIDYKNVILTPGNSPAALVNPLYASYVTINPSQAQVAAITALPFFTGFPTLPGCGTLTATNTTAYSCLGAIIDGRRANAGSEKLDGLDFQLSYRFAAPGGRVTLGASGTYMFNYDVQVVRGGPVTKTLNMLNATSAPLGAILRFRARGQLGFSSGGFDSNIFVNYTNPYSIVGLVAAGQNDHIPGYATVDATLAYTFGPQMGLLNGLRLSVSAINLFDKAPPVAIVTTTQQYDPANASIIGRQVTLIARVKF